MIILKLIWGMLLALAAGYHFNQAWEKEHGGCAEQSFTGRNVSKDTYVWCNPTSFLWIIVVIAGLFLLKFGYVDGSGIVVSILLNLTAFFSIYFVILMPLMPCLRRRISSRACATLWFCPIFMFYGFSFIGDDGFAGLFTVYLPRNVLNIVLIVWLTGFAASYIWSLASHLLFRRRVMNRSYAITDGAVLGIWDSVCEELEYTRPTALLISPEVNSPLSMGRTKRTRCTVLPPKAYGADELRMIFLHEAHHLQRWDVDTKVFLTIIKCLCWFNPMVWIAVGKASQDLELSCDEIVTEQMSDEERKSYARLLLNSASGQRGFTTCLSASAGALRYRLKNVVLSRSRKLGNFAIMLAVFISILCYCMISFVDSRGTLKSYVVPEGAEIVCPPASTSGLLPALDETDDCNAEINKILEGTMVEHYLNSANIIIDEQSVGYVFVNWQDNRGGRRLVTFYDHYVTVSDSGHSGFGDHIETYRILGK